MGLIEVQNHRFKRIVDEALESCSCVETVLVAKRIKTEIYMKAGRDQWLAPLLEEASDVCAPEINECRGPFIYTIYLWVYRDA